MKTYSYDFEMNFTKNGHNTDATICVRNKGNEKMFLACTLTKSSWFKTLNAAIKFMNRNGYEAA